MRKSLTIRRVIGVVGMATLLVAGGLAYADITPPPPFTGCDFLTGGGFIFPSDSKGTFAVGGGCRHGSGIAGVPYWGHLGYHDHGLDLNVHWNDITAYFPAGTTGTDPQTGMLRRFALQQTESMRFIITGGADRLPRAFATTLAPRIRYQSPVVRIEPGETCAGVVVGREGQRQRVTADHII